MKYLFCSFLILSLVTVKAQQQAAAPQKQPDPTVSVNDFITEAMQKGGADLHQQLAIWMPTYFWGLVARQMQIPDGTLQMITNEVGNYMMFLVVDYTMVPGGSTMTFMSEDDLRKSIKLVDASKMISLPLSSDKITGTTQTMIDAMLPVFQKLFGQFGQGMHIFLFDGKNANGKPLFDPSLPGSFSLVWEDAHLKWSLPFSCMMPVKYCPVDHEKMQGNWSYCPIHGVKL